MAYKKNKKNTLVKYKIIDEKGNVIVNDFKRNFRLDIHKHKLKKPFLTYDNKYFINPGSSKLKIVKSNDDKIIKFDIKKFKKYNIATLMDLVYAIEFSDTDFNKEINKYDVIFDDGKNKEKYKMDDGDEIDLNLKYKICDKNGKVLVNDKKINFKSIIHNHVLKKEFISFDNKYFFNACSKNFIINESSNDRIIPFNIKKFSKYNIITLRKLYYIASASDTVFNKEISKYDIIFDNDIDCLDPEVKSLVYALNNCGLSITTTGSCSGHNQRPPWVNIKFEHFEDLKNIIYLIDHKYCEKLIMTTKGNSYGLVINSVYEKYKKINIKNMPLLFSLTTDLIGREAYKVFDGFAKELVKHKKEWATNK